MNTRYANDTENSGVDGSIPSASGTEGDDCGKLIGSSGSLQRGYVLAEHP